MTFQVESIQNDFYKLEILPEMGASILNLTAASGRPVMRHVELEKVQTSSQCASFTLLPYSNRIRDARFPFEGQDIQLKVNTKDGLTQHGDVRNRPWKVSRAGETRLVCDFDSRDFPDINWPWAFTARVEYILSGPHFDTSLTLTNADTRQMPAGLGMHPYYTRLQDGIDPLISFDAALIYDTDERMLPLGAARPLKPQEDFRQPAQIGERQIDRGYTAWDGIARLDWGGFALTITADSVYSHLIAFTAPDGSFALEPVTHATDAFNLAVQGVSGTDMRTLAPGQSLAGTARVTLEGNW